MRKKKLLAGLLTAAMICSMPVSAFAGTGTAAEDGTGAEAPKEATKTDGTAMDNTSTGAATIDSTDGNAFYTTSDDDTAAADADTNGADINVWAKVIDQSTPVYKVDVEWGAMKFEYSSGSGKWNTTTHTYDGATGTGAWTVANYLDGTNNKLTVTNHSNVAVDTSYKYAMTETNMFNKTPETQAGASAVKGNFFDSNEKAAAAALVLEDTSTIADAFASTTKVPLHTADTYYGSADKGTLTEAGGRSDDIFFAFSGKPDEGVGATLDNFTKVGVITVTVEKKTDLTDFEF